MDNQYWPNNSRPTFGCLTLKKTTTLYYNSNINNVSNSEIQKVQKRSINWSLDGVYNLENKVDNPYITPNRTTINTIPGAPVRVKSKDKNSSHNLFIGSLVDKIDKFDNLKKTFGGCFIPIKDIPVKDIQVKDIPIKNSPIKDTPNVIPNAPIKAKSKKRNLTELLNSENATNLFNDS